jgi:hypothetical protein
MAKPTLLHSKSMSNLKTTKPVTTQAAMQASVPVTTPLQAPVTTQAAAPDAVTTPGAAPVTTQASAPVEAPATMPAVAPVAVITQAAMSQPGGNPTFAKKLITNVPKYVIQRILANISVIHSLVINLITGSDMNVISSKELLKNEINNLAENFKDPSLQPAINRLTDAADKPVSLFIDKFTGIIKDHIDKIVYKLGMLVLNIIGEIPVINFFTNTAAAASNAIHIAKDVSNMGLEIVDGINTFKKDMENVIQEFDPDLTQTTEVQHFLKPLPPIPTEQQKNYIGGSKLEPTNNVKDAKKHLHHLHRKKNRTLKRIHRSIHQFLSSNHNKRSIKAKIKVTH